MDLHNCFIDFDSKILLSKSKKDSIIKSRDAIRQKIRTYFSEELKINQPKFKRQGSFAINTALNPLEDDEVDIDDGLYLSHVDPDDIDTWPTPKEIHKTVIEALKNHTKDGCEDKTSCVRVIYQNDYHVDIPIYIMQNEHAKLANTKTNEWSTSDSKDFSDWYYANRKNDQTSRIVRYLKAWRDYKNIDMASIELTILAAKHHKKNDKDEIALRDTVSNILNDLKYSRKITKPVAPYENLWKEKSSSAIDTILTKFEQLKNDLNTAIDNDSLNRATRILQKQFGDRFTIIQDVITDSYMRNYDTGPKPWKM